MRHTAGSPVQYFPYLAGQFLNIIRFLDRRLRAKPGFFLKPLKVNKITTANDNRDIGMPTAQLNQGLLA